MEHPLFGCLRSPHATAQGLHPFSQSSLALHGRSDHMSYPELSTSSSSCIIAGYPNEEGMFASQHHRAHHHQHHQHHHHHHHHQQHQALQTSWHLPQMSSPPSAGRHSLCLQPDSGGPPELGSSPPVLCASSSSLGSGTPTGAACAPGDYGRQALSPTEAEKRSGSKRKSDSSGEGAPGTVGERGRRDAGNCSRCREEAGVTARLALSGSPPPHSAGLLWSCYVGARVSPRATLQPTVLSAPRFKLVYQRAEKKGQVTVCEIDCEA
ncbi:hypothetical protein MC885_013536 [Smutsia gigantea]|nr:hypothetical protein MC885_013536 [Smutsia gigantea]